MSDNVLSDLIINLYNFVIALLNFLAFIIIYILYVPLILLLIYMVLYIFDYTFNVYQLKWVAPTNKIISNTTAKILYILNVILNKLDKLSNV